MKQTVGYQKFFTFRKSLIDNELFVIESTEIFKRICQSKKNLRISFFLLFLFIGNNNLNVVINLVFVCVNLLE